MAISLSNINTHCVDYPQGLCVVAKVPHVWVFICVTPLSLSAKKTSSGSWETLSLKKARTPGSVKIYRTRLTNDLTAMKLEVKHKHPYTYIIIYIYIYIFLFFYFFLNEDKIPYIYNYTNQ